MVNFEEKKIQMKFVDDQNWGTQAIHSEIFNCEAPQVWKFTAVKTNWLYNNYDIGLQQNYWSSILLIL